MHAAPRNHEPPQKRGPKATSHWTGLSWNRRTIENKLVQRDDLSVHPVTRLEDHLVVDRRPALVHDRLDRDDSLDIDDLPHPSILGERVAHD